MISSRLSPSIGPDHDFPSLSIPVDHPPYFTDDRLGTLLRNAQNPRRIERRCRPAVVDSDRLPHVVIIRRAGYLPLSRSLRDFDREGHDFSCTGSQYCENSTEVLTFAFRTEGTLEQGIQPFHRCRLLQGHEAERNHCKQKLSAQRSCLA